MQVISDPIGREKIHFEAPCSNRLEKEMQEFMDWFDNNHDIDSVLKAGMVFRMLTTHCKFNNFISKPSNPMYIMMFRRYSDNCGS